MVLPETKILTLETLSKWRDGLRSESERLVLTNGCFDLLHRGHVNYLYRARLQGERLLVLVNSDASVRALKGSARPINSELDRAYVLAGLACVDAVLIFDAPRCTRWIKAAAAEFYAKGGDYTFETLNSEEREALIETGTRAVFIPFVEGYSTTQALQKI